MIPTTEFTRQTESLCGPASGSSLFTEDYEFSDGSVARRFLDMVCGTGPLPDMPSRLGCITTAAAFTTQYFGDRYAQSPEELDGAVERSPGEPASEHATILALLRCGLRVHHYLPELDRKLYVPYLRGHISFHDMNSGYDAAEGTTTDPEDYEFLRTHHERFKGIPSNRAAAGNV